MNLMSLLYKEFVINKIYLLIMLPTYIGALIFGFMFLEEEPTIFYYIFAEWPLIMMATFTGFDEYKKGEMLFGSLPVDRSEFIRGKYFTALMLTAACMIIALITAFMINIFFPSENYSLVMDYNYAFTSLFICLFLLSVILPLITRLGIIAGIGSFAVFIYVYFFALPRSFFLNGFYMIYKVHTHSGIPGSIPILVLIITAVFSISMIISGRLYRSKELVRI